MDNSIKYVNIEDLFPGEFQAHFENIGDNLDNLVNSISKYGIIIPLIVREKGINQYEIILGNRRYSAAKIVGLKEVPVIVLNVDDEKALDIVISDNIQRKELSAKEEANLYEKDLEYTNNNEEQLSNKLGIPIDRILSKLSFIRRNNQSNRNIQNTNQNIELSPNSISPNSSINQDIINLTELNKEEREEDNMNNEIINNQNLNTDTTKAPQQPQEPTFGGRFFPSLEDEPTNMNMNQNIATYNTTNTMNQQPEPLIDLTNDNNSNNEIMQDNNISNNIKTFENQEINSNPPTDIQQEEPIVPNLDALSTNIVDNSNTIPQQNTNIASSIESINNEPIPTNNLAPNINNNTSQIQSTIDSNQAINIDNNTPQDINISPNFNTQSITEDNLNINSPSELNQQIMNNTTNEMPIDNNIQVPPMPENINSEIINQQQNNQSEIQTNNIENQAPQKDIIPVINMIKSLAVNIENLGYNLNITENEDTGKYSINIEVEK